MRSPFERRVGTKGGGHVLLRLADAEVATVLASLRVDKAFMALITQYRRGLGAPSSFPEAAEIALRQRIFPLIDTELRKIDPRHQIFGQDILDCLFDEAEH